MVCWITLLMLIIMIIAIMVWGYYGEIKPALIVLAIGLLVVIILAIIDLSTPHRPP